eukprot:scaffold17400_cov110-Isochrysis_galbana.AAC.4
MRLHAQHRNTPRPTIHIRWLQHGRYTKILGPSSSIGGISPYGGGGMAPNWLVPTGWEPPVTAGPDVWSGVSLTLAIG